MHTLVALSAPCVWLGYTKDGSCVVFRTVATHPLESAGLSAAVSKIIFVLPVKGIVILDSEKDWPS